MTAGVRRAFARAAACAFGRGLDASRVVLRPGAAALLALGLLAGAFAGAADAVAQSVRVRDDRGVEVTLSAPPRRIVSLLPSLTESVCALGECARLVGVDRFSNWPDAVQSLPHLGGLDDAQVERIVALRPDLVLLSPSARAADRLQGLGLTLLALEPRDRADAKRALDVLGRVLDAAPRAAEAWTRIERQQREAAARVPARWRGRRAYFEVDAAPYAAGPESFIGETLAQLGLANVVPSGLGAYPKLNPEFVVRAQPDLLIAPRAALAEMRARPGWSTLRALRDGRVCGFDPAAYDPLVRPGPRMGEAALALADCLAALPAPH